MTGAGTANSKIFYQDYQASYSATLLHHYHQGKHQAEEPWYEAQPNCRTIRKHTTTI